VRVDHSRYADSRWYTGAGIYRNVRLLATDKLHIAADGVFVTTPEIDHADTKRGKKTEIPLFISEQAPQSPRKR